MNKKAKKVPEVDERLDQRVDLTAEITLTKAAPRVEMNYGEVEVIVSNSALDRHGEKIQVEGIDTKQVLKNPVVLWSHQYSDLPIGKISKLWKTGGNLMARIKLDYDIYDFADKVYQMILRGTINAVSIGGIVKAFGKRDDGSTDYNIISQLEMLELSIVPVGAHPDALVTSKSLGIEVEELRKQYDEFVHKALIDKIHELPQNEVELHIKSLKTLISALESSYNDSADPDPQSPQANQTKRVRKLILVKQTAKQVDKQAELIIAAINKFIRE